MAPAFRARLAAGLEARAEYGREIAVAGDLFFGVSYQQD